jgi:pilus assembly protein Flp/PilA
VRSLHQTLMRLLRSEDGPTAVEYAILLAVIAVSVIGALSLFGVHMDNVYSAVTLTLDVFL